MIDMAAFAGELRSLEEFGDEGVLIRDMLLPGPRARIEFNNADTQQNNGDLGKCHPSVMVSWERELFRQGPAAAILTACLFGLKLSTDLPFSQTLSTQVTWSIFTLSTFKRCL